MFYELLTAQMGHWTRRWMDLNLDEVEEACPFEIGSDLVEGGWINSHRADGRSEEILLFAQGGEDEWSMVRFCDQHLRQSGRGVILFRRCT